MSDHVSSNSSLSLSARILFLSLPSHDNRDSLIESNPSLKKKYNYYPL